MTIRRMTAQMKAMAPKLAATDHSVRLGALAAMRDALRENQDTIFAANRADIERAKENAVSEAVLKRLVFQEAKLFDVCAGIDTLLTLPDPVGEVTLRRRLSDELLLKRVTVPIGVLGVIFEARPDALVQIASLSVKSANACILKGGSETKETNAALYAVLIDAVRSAGLPEETLTLVESHQAVDELLTCEESVDLIIPRGSNAFVRYIMEHTRIPVMGHADGICHTYVEKTADPKAARRILLDAKLQYTAACNATETLLLDRAFPESEAKGLLKDLSEAGITLRGDEEARSTFAGLSELTEDGYDYEYLEPQLSVKLVDGVQEAAAFINAHGSHHTDAILTKDDEAAAFFTQMVDSAGVYVNASTRFADGFRYGFGAEVGISTGKLHARGPVGLAGLTTYKYILSGNDAIVGDYASGAKQFSFEDIAPAGDCEN